MDPNQSTTSKTTGIKRPSGIPSISNRLSSTTTRKPTGIPTVASSSQLSAGSTSNHHATTPTSTSSSTSSLQSSASSATLNNAQAASKLTPIVASKVHSDSESSSAGAATATPATPATVLSTPVPEIQLDEPVSDKEVIKLRNTVKDLNEKLETLKLKRAEDREKLREYEKQKLQIQQLQEFKVKAQEIISDLNKETQTAKQETKSAKEQFEMYKEEMSNHEQRIEEMTVDKELAEAKVEELQDDLNKANDKLEELKLELDVLKGEIELNGVEGAASSFQSKQLEKEQERLKAALIKLRDLSLQDKNEINNLRKQNEEYTLKFKTLSKENETLKTENQSNLLQINELKDQVTATLGSVQMIEQLTEQNLDLESKIIELKETIADLEAINEVNDQLQESAHEEERELRQNLDMAESRIREFEREIEFLKYKIADHEKTIVKFRELVQQLQNEKDEINRKMQSRIDDLQSKLTSYINSNSSQSASTYDFKQKLIETKNYAKLIENETNKVEIQNLKKYNGYLLSFMSDQFMKRSGDHECILTLLFFKRLINKSDLILNHVKEKYSSVMNKSELKPNPADRSEFVFEISMVLSNLKLICNKFDFILNTCNPKVYVNIGSMYFDINVHEKILDQMIDLLQKDQLDDNRKNLEFTEKMCIHLQTIYKNHLINEKYDEGIFLEDLVRFGTFACDSITIYLHYLNILVQSKDDQTEIMQLLKELNGNNEELKIFLKKISKLLPKEENTEKKIIISLPADLQLQLENTINNFYMIFKTLKELNNLASNTTVLNLGDSVEGGLPAKKLEDLAYQASDKVYLVDDNGPYENLRKTLPKNTLDLFKTTTRNSVNELNETLKNILSGLENGQYEKELQDEEYKIRKYLINAPVLLASEQFKNALIEAESIKYKLETKEEEIKELKKHLKLKVDELSEHKLRISLVESKADNALKESEEKSKKLLQQIDELKANILKKEKEHNETIEAMQHELDTSENEIRELKKKIPKKMPFTSQPSTESMIPKSPLNVNMSLADYTASPLLAQEVKLIKNLNKILEKNNSELKKNLADNLLSNLPPLPPTVQLLKNNQSNSKQSEDSHVLQPKDETISKLYKQSNDLMKNIYSSLANVRVQELNPSNKTYNESKKKENSNEIQLKCMYLTASQIQSKILDVQNELLKSKANIQNKSGENNLKNSGIQNLNQSLLKPNEKKFVAEISLPCHMSKAKTIDLNINYDEIKELLRNI